MARTRRDQAAADSFVEKMAMTFADLGFPRMAARVLFTLMVTEDEDGLTASELAVVIGASPAAISGAVRYLQRFDLVERHPVRGSRADRYRLPDQAWYQAMASESPMHRMLATMADDGIAALGGPDTVAGRRVVEMRDFFEFMQDEMLGVLERWRTRTSRETSG